MKKSNSQKPQDSQNEFTILSEKNRYGFKRFKQTFLNLYVSLKFIYLILVVLLFTIVLSVFIPSLSLNDNIVAVRASFSSIIGYLLESTTSKISANNRFLLYKNTTVGMLSLLCAIIITIALFLDIESNNASLILIKNTLLSSISFLICSVKRCVSNSSSGADGCLPKDKNQTDFAFRCESKEKAALDNEKEKISLDDEKEQNK